VRSATADNRRYFARSWEIAVIDVVFIALLQAAAGEPAAAQQTTTQTTQPQQTSQQSRMRCRNVRATGSRVMTRRCTTPETDELLAEEASRAARDFQSQSGRGGR